MNEVYRAKLNDEYRLVIPAACRKRLGLQAGQEMLIKVTELGLEMTTYDLALKRFQEHVQSLVPAGESLVDELIAERRAEAAKEASE
jgi:bifunctional DNA-binding transcriptional regulator/antitoxin component of YhaV-PrlF toxin-antitoxin module